MCGGPSVREMGPITWGYGERDASKQASKQGKNNLAITSSEKKERGG